ncbi:MAG: hypothetical protein UZ16_OP3001001964 [Candidatus Hinthialibacteria bacterium OLB16]|nr:MAG: hypothetical protein UZ16_OP3001001964 [Candidatus Hinthialibacteria bacterium OLB16]
MAACTGQQRNIVAHALITVGTAQVEYLDPPGGRKAWVGQVGARRHDLDSGDFQRPVMWFVNNEKDRHIGCF